MRQTIYVNYVSPFVMSKETPEFVTKKLRKAWQPYVDKLIRRFITQGKSQLAAVDRALDLRDNHIRKGDKPPKK